MSLHDKIMNIPIRADDLDVGSKELWGYKSGHRDATYDAAKLALSFEADLEHMTDSRDSWRHIAGDYKERIDRQDALIAELVGACSDLLVCMKLANWEGDHVAEKARAAIAKAKQHMGVEK